MSQAWQCFFQDQQYRCRISCVDIETPIIRVLMNSTFSLKPFMKSGVMFVGGDAAGKSSIINRFINDTFDPDILVHVWENQSTIGIDFSWQNIQLEDKLLRIQLWDTKDNERSRCLLPSYQEYIHVIVVVCDVAGTEPEAV